jgi:hypothetical protein
MNILEVKSEWWYIVELAGSRTRGWVPSQYIRIPKPVISIEDTQTLFRAWREKVAVAMGEKAGLDKHGNVIPHRKVTLATFPNIPVEFLTCVKTACANRKSEKPLGACEHEVEALLKGAGEKYCAKWLWRESLMWHPDQFTRKCHDVFREGGAAMGGEMFVILGKLMEKERASERIRAGID